MHLAEIWRYPVKSMAGESLAEAELTSSGVEGDRRVQVRVPDRPDDGPDEGLGYRVITSRSRPQLLGHRARLGAGGELLVDGRPWGDPAVAAEVERAAGAGARLVRADVAERFDILPLLVMTDGAIAVISEASLAAGSVATDRRRFRPNLLIAGVPGLAERGWEGRRLRIGGQPGGAGEGGNAGGVVVGLADLRGRCVMTTFDPDTLVQEPRVLRTVALQTGGVLGLNAEVVRAGRVRVGDAVELLPG